MIIKLINGLSDPCNLLINGIFEWRNALLERGTPTEDVDELILKIIKKCPYGLYRNLFLNFKSCCCIVFLTYFSF